MLIQDALNIDTKNKLIQFMDDLKHQALWEKATPSDFTRKQTKGSFYANEVIKIRMMSVKELIEYRNSIRKNKAVQEAKKIRSPYLYRQFDLKVRQIIELCNYAENRLAYLK